MAFMLGEQVTLEVVRDMPRGVDGAAVPETRLLRLPLEALEWESWYQRRVIRHELAHIALDLVLGSAPVPIWFEEGFAEWASGGLDCKGEARVRLDIMSRRRTNRAAPRLFDDQYSDVARVAKDYFGLFFSFLEDVGGGVVSDGALLGVIRVRGIRFGLEEVMGLELSSLELEWQKYVVDIYGDTRRSTGAC